MEITPLKSQMEEVGEEVVVEGEVVVALVGGAYSHRPYHCCCCSTTCRHRSHACHCWSWIWNHRVCRRAYRHRNPGHQQPVPFLQESIHASRDPFI